MRAIKLPTSSYFLVIAFVALVVIQWKLIRLSPNFAASAADLKIYREVGQLVVNGVDPYDFEAQAELRNRLRLDDYGLKENDAPLYYNYYVSGNLPASTLLFGAIEWITGGSTLGWRIAFAVGNLSLFLATVFFLWRYGIPLDRLTTQLAFSLTVLWYPSLLYWGTVIPEDKQFQTALMLALAALLARAGPLPRTQAAVIGVTGALSLLFKAFGLFLAPLAIRYLRSRPRAELACAAIVAAATAALFALYFHFAFVELMLARLISSSAANVPLHGSPWTLYPAGVVYLRPLLSAFLIGLIMQGYRRGQIDLLNLCAATLVVFVCVWQRDSSMDRMNMGMIFALICSATLSVRLWLALAAINAIAQYPIYDFLCWQRQYDAGINAETLDAIAAAIFVGSYFTFLTCLYAFSDARARFALAESRK